MLKLLYMNLNDENEQKDDNIEQKEPVVKIEVPSVLEINVFDKVAGKSVGPGQK